MRLVFKKENLAVNVFVVTLLLLIFQVGKFFAAQNYQMFFDILLSFLLGIFLFSLTVLLFGHFKKKLVFMTGLVATAVIIVLLGFYSLLYPFFIMVGVLLSVISVSENLLKSLLGQDDKRREERTKR